MKKLFGLRSSFVSLIFTLLVTFVCIGYINPVTSFAQENSPSIELNSAHQITLQSNTRTTWRRVPLRERYYLYSNGATFIFDTDYTYISDEQYARGYDYYPIGNGPGYMIYERTYRYW